MEILQLDPLDLRPYQSNNRKHPDKQLKLLRNSIKEFGFTAPIVVDSQNEIIAGHGRWLCAKKLNLTEIPCVRIEDLTQEQIRRLRLLDNEIATGAERDLDNILSELKFLESEGTNLEAWGLDTLFEILDPKEDQEIIEEEFESEIPDKTDIKLGDLIELADHRVVCGDSSDPEIVKIVLNNDSPNIMCTDPPYGINLDQSWRDGKVNRNNSNKRKILGDHNADWTSHYELFPGNIFYCWHAGKKSLEVLQSIIDSGFELNQQLIWVKSVMTLSRTDYHCKHEPCFYSIRKGKTHSWIGDRKQTTVIEAAAPAQRAGRKSEGEDLSNHPTQKPIACMSMIANHEGDVYDPFLGSGTTLLAAEQLGKKCFGVELDPYYCQIIIDRYKNLCARTGKPAKIRVNGQVREQ